MKKCNVCSADVQDDVKFCATCGAKMPDDINSGFAGATNYTQPDMNSNFQQQTQQPYNTYNSQNQNYSAPAQSDMYRQAPAQNQFNQQPPYASSLPSKTDVMSVGSYVGTILLSMIPIVGFILLLIWSFGNDANLNKRNFARAWLIVQIIITVISAVLSTAISAMIIALIEQMYYYM